MLPRAFRLFLLKTPSLKSLCSIFLIIRLVHFCETLAGNFGSILIKIAKSMFDFRHSDNSSSDNSYQATTHIRRQLISIWKGDDSYQAIIHINMEKGGTIRTHDISYKNQNQTFRTKTKTVEISGREMSGFIFVPIVRVRNVGFLAIVRNVVCTNCRGAGKTDNSYQVCQ